MFDSAKFCSFAESLLGRERGGGKALKCYGESTLEKKLRRRPNQEEGENRDIMAGHLADIVFKIKTRIKQILLYIKILCKGS